MDPTLKAAIDAQLASHRIMSLATVRPDGWPQVTMVGYVSQEWRLYFVVASTSQKFANISREPRVSIAVGEDSRGRAPLSGLSMAARAAPVEDYGEIDRLNQLIIARYPDVSAFAPFEPSSASSVVIRAIPEVISVIDHARGRGRADLIRLVDGEWRIAD